MKNILKLIYNKLPLKKEFFLLAKKFFKFPKPIYQHLYFKDKFSVHIDRKRKFEIIHYGYVIENEIFWNGIFDGWEKYSMRLWKELCEHSNVIFDVGANTGIYSLVAKATNPTSKVYAFEPVERVFEKLKYNVNLNNYDITCVKKAISKDNGKALIYDSATEHTLSVAVNKNISHKPEDTFEVEIDTVKLDTYIKKNDLNKLDLVKIDVETHEVEALLGFKEYIEKFQPTILIEILNDEIAEGISEIISHMNYVYFNIDENKGIRKVTTLGKSDYYNFLLCKPSVVENIEILRNI